MKYTIEGFDQKTLVQLGLDSSDALILRWFVDFYFSGRMAKVVIEGDEYLWVKYQACIDDLPIIRIANRQVIARRFKKYVECGLMKQHIATDAGTYTCYRLVEEVYRKLIFNDDLSQGVDYGVEGGGLESQPGVDSTVNPKDYSINKDSSINNIIPEAKSASDKIAVIAKAKNEKKAYYCDGYDWKDSRHKCEGHGKHVEFFKKQHLFETEMEYADQTADYVQAANMHRVYGCQKLLVFQQKFWQLYRSDDEDWFGKRRLSFTMFTKMIPSIIAEMNQEDRSYARQERAYRKKRAVA